MSLDVVRLECGSLFVMRDGGTGAAQGLQREAEVVVPVGHAIVERDRFADHVGRYVGAADLNADQAGIVEAADVLWLDRENVTIEIVSISELTCLVMLHSLREQPVNVARRDIHRSARPRHSRAVNQARRAS